MSVLIIGPAEEAAIKAATERARARPVPLSVMRAFGLKDFKGTLLLGDMINVASARNGVGYGKWTHIDGFSESVIMFMREFERG